MNAQHDFATDFQRRRQQQIHRPPNRAFGRIFNRHHGVMSVAGLDFAENIVDRGLRQQPCGVAEMLGRRAAGERTEWAEEGNPQWFFERQAGRHDFAEEKGDGLAR